MVIWIGFRGEQGESLFLGTPGAVGYGGWSTSRGLSEQMGLGPWPLPLHVPDVSFKNLFPQECNVSVCVWGQGAGELLRAGSSCI